MTIKSEILEIVREMQPIKAAEIHQLCPHIGRQQIYGTLSTLEIQGALVSEKVKDGAAARAVSAYSIGNGIPKRLRQITRHDATPVAIVANDAAKRIAELEAWKAEAIARYPDLAVAPSIIRARSIVSALVKKEGDDRLSHDVQAGRKDGTILVRAVAQALEEAG